MIKAYAKINLSLFVTGLRDDGYHEIKSVFLKVGLFDTLRVIPYWRPYVVSSKGPQGKENLVWRALGGRPYRVEIFKNIPIGSGLGGGSSDAAAVLKYFEQDMGKVLSKGIEIGSDVTFFIYESSAAVVEGRGEIVKPFKISKTFFIVLYHPGVSFSTADEYREIRVRSLYFPEMEAEERVKEIKNILNSGKICRLKPLLYNTFEEIHNESFISNFKDLMERYGACGSLMTGSGSALFAIFEEFPQQLYWDYGDKFIFTTVVSG